MLPFLKPKQASVAGLIIKNRTPDKDSKSNNLEEKSNSIEDCAQELISAIQANDKAKVAAALKEAFKCLEAMPHDEAPHTYEDQNKEK